MPVAVSLAYLYYMQVNVDWAIGLWTLLTVVTFHAAGNTWSDYFDFKKGVDRADNIGGTSLTSGEFRPAEIIRLSCILMAVAVISGLILTFHTGLPTLYFGLIGVALTLLYPRMKYNALGDVDIFITYSLLPMLATCYVASGIIFYPILWLAVPLGLITVAILHINNTRDIDSDRRAGIRTFAMLTGKKSAAYIYCVEIFLPFIWVIGLIIGAVLPPWALLVLPALIPAIKATRKALRFPAEGMTAIIGLDEATAQLQLIFSMLLIISCVTAVLI